MGFRLCFLEILGKQLIHWLFIDDLVQLILDESKKAAEDAYVEDHDVSDHSNSTTAEYVNKYDPGELKKETEIGILRDLLVQVFF